MACRLQFPLVMKPAGGQGTIEYLAASLWIVVLLTAAGLPERFLEAIRERIARSEAVLRMPSP